MAFPLSLCMGFSDEIEVETTIDIGHNNAATILVIKVTIALPFQSTFTALVTQWRQINLPKKLVPFLFPPLRRRRGCAKLTSSVTKQTSSWYATILPEKLTIWCKTRDEIDFRTYPRFTLYFRLKCSAQAFFFVFLFKSFVFLFFKLLDLLLETKVNGCVRDVKHRTPLHLAAERGTARQVKVLTQAAPSCVWMRDDQRRTPLHYAVMSMKRYNNFQFLQDLNTKEPFFVNTFIIQAHRCLRTVLLVPKLSADFVQFLPL